MRNIDVKTFWKHRHHPFVFKFCHNVTT